MTTRLLKDPGFVRWARKQQLGDETLCLAADEIEKGLIDACLGEFLLKKQIARPGGWQERWLPDDCDIPAKVQTGLPARVCQERDG